MSGLGALFQGVGSGLVAATGPLMQGVKEEQQALREEQLMQMRETLERNRIQWKAGEDTRIRKEQGKELMAAAEGNADARGAELAEGARKAYRSADMSDEDINTGLAAVDEAQAGGGYKQKVTADDIAQGGVSAGLVSPREYMVHEMSKEKDAREDRKVDLQARITEIKEAAAAAKIDLDSKKLDAMIKGIGAWAKNAGGGGSEAAYLQTWKLYESKFPKDTPTQTMEKVNMALRGEAKVGEYVVTETEKDNLDGSKTKTVEKRKAGAPNAAPAKAGFKWVDGKIVPN